MLGRIYRLARYNRDWARYLWGKYRPPRNDELLTFRLRNGQTVTLKAEVRFLLNEIYLDRVYDVPGVDFPTCRSILDLGANMGVFALYAAARAPGATVYCLEPAAQSFAILERNIRQNNVQAKLFRLAVAATCGAGHLSVVGTSAGYALGPAGPGMEQVECVDLEKVFELTGVEAFDFVKMDVEGAERDILTRCSDELLSRINALVIEWHHSWEELEALAERLRTIGFLAEPRLLDQIQYLWARQPAGRLA